jgi:signal peptidase II
MALLVFAADRVTKCLALGGLRDAGPVTLVPGVMDLYLTFNEGAAFSLGSGLAWLFALLGVAAAVAAAVYVRRARPSRALVAALAAVAGGALGNALDRAVLGAVVDFLKTTFVDFPVFNVADVAITCGCAAAFVLLWREGGERS